MCETACNLFRDSSHSQLNPNKSQITGFHKTRNTTAGNPRAKSSKKTIIVN